MPADGGQWQLRLGLGGGLVIADYREYLPPGEWIIRLTVGADDGAARTYDVHISWDGSESDPGAALDNALDRLAVIEV